MKTRRESNDLWVVSLERGDSLRESLESFAAQEGIQGAQLNAIGALENPELGSYDLPTKTYHRQVFSGIWELVSLEGNVTLNEGKPFLHAHVTIAGHDYDVKGGHLFDAQVGVVVEMFVRPLQKPLLRLPCAAIGLSRWEPTEESGA